MRITIQFAPVNKYLIFAALVFLTSCGASSGGDGSGQPGSGNTTNTNSLRFYGNGVNDIDRVKIIIDDPTNSDAGPPADIGAEDFTIEFWMKANATDNPTSAITCGENYNWIYGNIIVDRDRYNQFGSYGFAVGNGRIAFGLTTVAGGVYTLCATTNILDNQWHHVAAARRLSDGYIWLFIDGFLEAQVNGPDGDLSYPDDGVPGNFCSGSCINSDPFLVLGAEKHDAGLAYPAYNGFLDEFRLSNTLRYTTGFTPQTSEFVSDPATMLLLDFDEGVGVVANDSAPGGAGDGVLNIGGIPQGPVWTTDTPF